MKRYKTLIIFLIGTLSLAAKTITDMAGREVILPPKVERILPYDAKTSIFIFPVLKNKMVATAILPGKKDYQFIDEAYKTMPEVDLKNVEAVLHYKPQVILYSIYDKNNNTSPVLNLGRRLNIPVVMVNLSLDKLDKAYDFLSTTFDIGSECASLRTFLKKVYQQSDSLKTAHQELTCELYYSVGPSGLMTDPAGSKHTEVLDYMALNNAAKVGIPSGGHAQVNLEQVLLWNPDYILAGSFRGKESAYRYITTDHKWASINAVKSGKVFKIPTQPLGWLDHPPSINRIPGIIWLSEIFYDYPKEKAKADIIQFYQLFYNYHLSDEEYASLFHE